VRINPTPTKSPDSSSAFTSAIPTPDGSELVISSTKTTAAIGTKATKYVATAPIAPFKVPLNVV
jgi:hypothetical protein